MPTERPGNTMVWSTAEESPAFICTQSSLIFPAPLPWAADLVSSRWSVQFSLGSLANFLSVSLSKYSSIWRPICSHQVLESILHATSSFVWRYWADRAEIVSAVGGSSTGHLFDPANPSPPPRWNPTTLVRAAEITTMVQVVEPDNSGESSGT